MFGDFKIPTVGDTELEYVTKSSTHNRREKMQKEEKRYLAEEVYHKSNILQNGIIKYLSFIKLLMELKIGLYTKY